MNCIDCLYWKRLPDIFEVQYNVGECKRYPPKKAGLFGFYHNPEVSGNDRCGEFSPIKSDRDYEEKK